MNEWYTVEFIGGPLDGPRPMHPAMNRMLRIETNPEGYYLYLEGNYYWVTCDGPVARGQLPVPKPNWFRVALEAVGRAFTGIW